MFTVPWDPDPRLEKIRELSDADAVKLVRIPDPVGTFNRPHGSPFYTTKIPDLHPLRYSQYMDATGTHRLRGPEDVARYAAFILGADPMEFGPYKILPAEQRRIRVRVADEILYGIGMDLMSLEPLKILTPRRSLSSHEGVKSSRGKPACSVMFHQTTRAAS
jgi:hypothetical protein